ncbi:hypothetical protein M2232_004586 [Bradyrhizobium japonicum]|nr:hypothetical protein [Bradyrhizobium japonicum]MCW2345666.1 hypothetical protein [Bradyrhizobium japonicum]
MTGERGSDNPNSRMILLNTNVVSEAMKPEPHPSVRDWLDAQAAETAPKVSPDWTCRSAAYPTLRSWMIGFSPSGVTSRLASVIGSLKRRRPALPGFT